MYFNQFFEMEEPVKENADGPLVTKDYVIAYGHSKVSKNVVFGIGDMPAGTSNVISKSALKNKQKLDRCSSKPSQIPRYRYHQKEPPILEIPTKSMTEHANKIERTRRKLLMKSSLEKMQLHSRRRDIRSDMQSESSSAIITKVLLEEIRGRHKIGSDRLNEWLMESATDYLRPIANCLGASNISSTMVPQTSQSECDVNTRMSIEKRLIEALSNKNHNAIIALDKNMPYIAFEDLELDMRPEHDVSNNDHIKDHVNEIVNQKNTEVTTNAVFENCILKTKEYFKSKSQRKKAEKDVEKITERKAHSRVDDAELDTNEMKKCIQYNVGSGGDHLTETERNDLSGTMYDATEHMPTSSYIDCPSEILQRMTNLEAEGYDIASTVSGTDIEIRDDFLSNYNFEQAYSSLMEGRSENWILDNCNDSLCCIEEPVAQEPNICKLCTSCAKDKKQKKGARDSHDYHHHYCWRREVAKKCSERTVRYRGRCKKCHKHRNNQIRIPRPFITFTKHFSVGRICRRRWNLMWKGTAERWASKPKSHSRCRTFATVLDLQRSGFWENADVQTTVLLYHEAGTDAVAKEQKSTGIVPPPKLYSEACTKIESDTSIDNNQLQKQQTQIGTSTAIKYTKNNSPEQTGKINHPINNATKLYKTDISTCIDPMEDLNRTTTVVTLKEKGINKNTDYTNSTKYRSQIDRAIETDGSLLLITKKRSSVSVTSDIAMVVNLNAHEAFNQTDELEQVDTEANVNYNNSLEISCDDSSLFSYDVDFYKPHAVETESVEYGYPQSQRTIRMVKPKVSRRRSSAGGQDLELTSHHNVGIITSNKMLSPPRGNINSSRHLVYTSDKSGDTLSTDVRSCDYSKLLISSSADTEDQDDDEKDASTGMAQFNDLTKETSRYLCSRQYDTNAHGTYTGSSFFIEAIDRDTNTNICDIYIDTAVSSPNLIETCNFNGGPVTHHVHKAVSTQGLVQRYSFNGGSHRSQRSFTADVHPDYTTNCTSMTEQSITKPAGVKSALIRDIEKQSGFEDKSHTYNSSDSSSSGTFKVSPAKRAVAIQVVLDNTGHDVKSRRVLSTSVGIFTSLHGLSQSIQTPYNKLAIDNELGFKLIPATSQGTYTSCHMAGAAVQTAFKTVKKSIGTQLPATAPSDVNCQALAPILTPMKKSCLSKKSTSAMQIQTFIHCQAVPKLPKATSSEDLTTEGAGAGNEMKNVKQPPTLSTMIDKITTTDQELKCIRQEIKSNVRNIGIHVNFKSKVNRTAKELNKKVSLPIKKNKWNKGKLKEYLFVYDIPHIIPHSIFTEQTSPTTPSIRSSHILCEPTFVEYVSDGAQTSAREWKLYNEERNLNKGAKQRVPSSGSPRNLKKSNLFYLEACTMKPSTFHNAGCQTYEYIIPVITIASASTCSLSPALSLTDICEGRDKNELQAVYYMLSAIEGRIRRLKRNIRCRQ
ncbi:PREDICTED: uncharacterized protein LOC106100239 isoform X2 [Papilio polytes]|uniref:uncharacterized protein LOC106100239 isoform X2 n=1 Tax=Papilio polytes TaxID=76194 RepID=UPI0006761EF6|nr:PREDICTED: uncharacterized protein LOC106100239 isoform X2 [Papilio polytes]